MKKLICFDFDGTMVNSWPPYEDLATRYTKEMKLPKLCLDTLRVGYGYPREHQFWEGLEPDDQHFHLHQMFKINDDPEHPLCSDLMPQPFDNVLDTLDNLKVDGYTLAIVTARPSYSMKPIVDAHDMEKYFCGQRTMCDIKNRGEKSKPHPDQLISVMKELGFAPEETVMVGDTCMDMKMARAANTYALGVTWGNHCENRLYEEGGAHHVLENCFSEISNVLNELKAIPKTA
jgi:phosphoglycolate phosphatase